MKEIARRANISIGTIDRVIHNRTGVSQKTSEKIKQIVKGINYQLNILGRILAIKKQFCFAILIPKVFSETSFWAAPLKGIQTAESEIKHYNIEIKKYFYNQNSKTSFVTQTRKILKEDVDVILFAPTFINESVIFTNRCRKLNKPYVLIESDIPGQPRIGYWAKEEISKLFSGL